MKYESRKYIDLIRKAEGKWASWDPPIPYPEVGDYGTIDSETGKLEKEGNIYDESFAEFLTDLKETYPPEHATPDEEIVIQSSTAQKIELTAGPEVNLAGIADASFKGKWKFPDSDRGALLVMVQPRLSFLPRNILLKQLVNIPALADKDLVTEIVQCTAYALYLSSKQGDEVSLALSASIPVPVVPSISAGGELGGSWWTQASSGILKRGRHPEGAYSYTPLFTLKRIRPPIVNPFARFGAKIKGRYAVTIPKDDNLWMDSPAPWDTLDEDGAEKPKADAETPLDSI